MTWVGALTTPWPKEELCWLQVPHEVHSAPSGHSEDISAGELAAAETHPHSAASSSHPAQAPLAHSCSCVPALPVPLAVCSVPRHSWDCASWRFSASNLLLPSQDLMVLQQTQSPTCACVRATYISCAVKGLQLLPAKLDLTGPGEDLSGLN